MGDPEELGESELGTREYWDSRYEEELKNFQSHGDPGDVWFGDDAVDRIMKWLRTKDIPKTDKIVDVGCGNGMFLIDLAVEGYKNLHGLDYSERAITLAKSIAEKQDFNIDYSACDVLKGLPETYDVIHDKGTYDAISLSSNAKEDRTKYLESIHASLHPTGHFIITSCNWTQHELNQQFQKWFEPFEIIPVPQFRFGGKVGSVVTSVVYKKL